MISARGGETPGDSRGQPKGQSTRLTRNGAKETANLIKAGLILGGRLVVARWTDRKPKMTT